jgi:tetratricopeptide (TPR) repeat protein
MCRQHRGERASGLVTKSRIVYTVRFSSLAEDLWLALEKRLRRRQSRHNVIVVTCVDSLAVQLYLARKFDRAIEQAYDTLEMDGNFAISYVVLGEVYLSKGMYRDGLSALEKYSALSRRNATSLAFLGYSHARLGERNEALRMIEELKAASQQSFVPALFVALVYAGLEDKDQAFTWLEKACEERFNRLAYINVDALWDPLRSDPRFADLLRLVGIPP